MRGLALLFLRDLRHRWMLFVASLAMGLFNVGLPLLRARVTDAELRGAAGLITALTWSAVLALVLGGSIFTRDLTENRLAFDFRLPVRPSSIWAARLLAAIVTIALCAALLLLPSALAGMDSRSASAGLDEWIGHGANGALAFAPLAILALLLISHPIALATRTRSAWAGVDMLSVAIASLAATWSIQALTAWQADGAIWQSIRAITCIAFLGAAISSLLQLVRGRSEPDKAQRVLSLGLLATATVGATAVLGLTHWTLRPQLEDLIGNASNAQSLGPDWVALQGPTRRARSISSRFLIAPASGRRLRLGPLPGDPGTRKSIAASLDDSTIAWLESDSESSSLRFFRLSTGAERPVAQPTPTSTSDRCVNWVLSPDGTFVAALEMLGKETDPMRLVVSRLATGDVVASLQFPHCRVYGDMLFASSQEILVPCGFPSQSDVWSEVTRIVHVDLAAKTTRDEQYRPAFPPALDASLGMVRTGRGWKKLEITKPAPIYGRRGADYGFQTAWRLRDLESGRALPELVPPELVTGYSRVYGIELSEGTLALLSSTGREQQLSLYAGSREPKKTISLGGGMSAVLAESSDAGTLIVGTYSRGFNGPGEYSLVTVDLRTGTIALLDKGLHPAGWLGEIGSTLSVFADESGHLRWFNPQTRRLQPLLGDAQYFESALPTGGSS